MLKMYTFNGYWVVKDGERLVPFKKSYDAWAFVLLLREIRPKVPMGERSFYPVKTLDPRPERRTKNVRLHS
jgi:hypothetical protein